MHASQAGRAIRTSARAGLSANVNPSLKRLMSSTIQCEFDDAYKARRARVLKAACCRQTPHFDSQEYIEADGDVNRHVIRNQDGIYTCAGTEIVCYCSAFAWPASDASNAEKLRHDVRTFRTHPTYNGDTLLHSLPACRTKLLLEHGAPVSARNVKTIALWNASFLTKHDPQLLARIEQASKNNGDQCPHIGIAGTYYFVGKDGNPSLARGVSRRNYRSGAGYSYHGLTPLMSAIDDGDLQKVKILLTASSKEDIQKDLLDLQIIAGHARLRNRTESNLLKLSKFEIALKKYE